MEAQQFVNIFRKTFDVVVEADILLPSKGEEDYCPGDFTFLWNLVLYDLVRDYNASHSAHLQLCAEPEAGMTPRGRGGYSDILIHDAKTNKDLITLEHENFPGTKNKLREIVRKLAVSKAKAKFLITYSFDNLTRKEILAQLSAYVHEYFRKGESLHTLIAKNETECGDDYLYAAVKGDTPARVTA